jgi:terminase small subunit-like protein
MPHATNLYTPELGEQICEGLMEGLSLREVLLPEGMPVARTVYRWLAREEGFRKLYLEAQMAKAWRWADEMMEIADDGRNDWMERNGKDGSPGYVLNGEHVQRSRLRVDTRKFAIAKLLPSVFGDTVKAEISGPNGGPIEINETDLARRALLLLAKAVTHESTGDK